MSCNETVTRFRALSSKSQLAGQTQVDLVKVKNSGMSIHQT